MLLAGEQFAAAVLAIVTAVVTSLLAPDWMARSAVIESLTPPAHDSMSVVRSWTIPRRSAARCSVDGRCATAASASPATSTAAAASIQVGVRSTGHPEGREATPPRPSGPGSRIPMVPPGIQDRKSTRLNSSHSQISYAVFCLKKKKQHLRQRAAERPAFGDHFYRRLP